MKQLFLCVLFTVFSGSAFSQLPQTATRPASPPPPVEVKQTIDAIAGKWEGNMTVRIPAVGTETFPWFMDCAPAALGAGAACTMTGEASIGPISQSCIVAYDPEGKAVHYMCVTSMGEVHDHKGNWKDDQTIEFEPLNGSLMGKPMTETILWSFTPNTIRTTSIIATADGSTMRFEFSGKRQEM